jgi:Tol biopolymer transport system component
LAVAPVEAVVRGANGRILFTRAVCDPDTDPCWEIVAADADDSHEVILAGPYARGVWSDHFIANWAPDARSVIFMADLGDGQAIWQVDADGTGMHEVFAAPDDGTGLDDGPAFTPDGSRIIFTRCCPPDAGYGLWSIGADGSDLRLFHSEAVAPGVDGPSDNLPQVSPDGLLVAFHRNLNYCGCYIATVDAGGGDLQGLSPVVIKGQVPNWSPDGKRIVFAGFVPDANVWAVNVDGTGLTQLTSDTGDSYSAFPSYSPDGTRIIFVHGDPSTSGAADLFTMDPDGTGWQPVTHTATNELFPQWAPLAASL